MTDLTESLAAIRAALEPIGPLSSDAETNAATAAASAELRKVASSVAEFANALDDGTGFFNSSSEFGRQLATEFDAARRGSTVMGLIEALNVPEALRAVELALLHVQGWAGPHAARRVLLTEQDRKALRRISDGAIETLLDAAMPADPEDEEP